MPLNHRRPRWTRLLKTALTPLDEKHTPRRWKFADITLDMLDRGGVTVVCLSIVGGAIAGDILQVNAFWGMAAGVAVLTLVIYVG
ncbi:hypothetical protein [Kushneria aurantia]|uniref:Uncharacterized protein n=1 Tax=Kushneria aurantia TaxID=504092 RepID=A0ABV6G429_9GAMM|nr:hypothetical protein [Kushneria aurantia]